METIDELFTQAEGSRRSRVHDHYRQRIDPLHDWAVETDAVGWPTFETVRHLQAVSRAADASQALGLRYLLRFVTGEYLSRQMQSATTRLLSQQQAAVIEVPILDEPVPFWQVNSLLAQQRKRFIREALERATTSAIEGFYPRYGEFWSHLYATVEALGYPHLIALWEEVSGVGLEAFLKSIEAILRETDDTYRDRMQWHLTRTLGIRLEDAKRHDMLALFGRDETAAWFPRADMIPSLDTWLHDWGWPFEERSNLHIEPCTALASGAWCAAFEIPADIRLAVAPADGLQGYAQAFREAGKALLLASLPGDAAGALRCFPDPSLLESQAELLGGLISTPRWVQIYRHIRQPVEGLSLAKLERLYIVRRYLGKCLYERTLYEDSGLDGKEEAYRDALRRACGFSYPEAYYLHDVDPAFGAFWNVRGWLLGTSIRRQLHQQYADEWFREADALRALQIVWGQSLSHSVEALGAQEGSSLPNVDLVVADLLSDL